MGQKRDATYPIRMNEEELMMAKAVAKKTKLPELIREFIRQLYLEKGD